MKEIRNLIESSEEYRIQGNAGAAHLKLLDAIRALVASVEALEKSEANAHFGFALHGSEIATLRDRVEALEKRCLSSSGHLDKRIDECTASGGPKREPLPNPLDQWGDPPFPAEATPKPNPDLWSSCAPKPCTFCGEVTTTSYNATPMHRGCSKPAQPPAAPERQERKACPCHHVTPCSPECTCVKPWSSRGCARCCSYGNPEQQKARAVHLTQHPAQWRDIRSLEKQWRGEADQLNRDFPRYPKCEEKADLLRICADQLAALLPPEKEPKP